MQMKRIMISHKTVVISFARRMCVVLLCTVLLAACSLYRKYDATPQVPENLMGNVVQDGDTACLGDVGWREIFTDTLLQKLIERAWVNNTDVQVAELTIAQAQNDMMAARLVYLPMLSFEPGGSISRLNGTTTRIYDIPLVATWQLNIFGQVTSKKRQAEAEKAMQESHRQAVRASLAANVANTYYSLVMLDHELEILLQTQVVWEESLESMRILYEAGLYPSPAVYRMEASLAAVQSGIAEIRENILSAESTLCRLLSETPHAIERSTFGSFRMPEVLSVGVPLRLLSARPDVRMAEKNVEVAYYVAQQAHQSFYPDITISANIGWSNGQGLVNPSKFLLEALGSIVQPLFQQGKLKARYRNAQIEQEKMRLQFVQTLLNAGNEVYRHLHTCRKAEQKATYIAAAIAAMEEAYMGTRELMKNGTNTYLEVLTAQEDLLSAQLTEVENRYDGIQALINLYTALGGF